MFDRSPFPSGFYADLCLRNLSTIERERVIYAARPINLHEIDRPSITLDRGTDYEVIAQ